MLVLFFLGSIVQHFQCIPKFRKFRNLRQLKLTVRGFGLETLLGYTSLLEACPFLHTFAVKVNYILLCSFQNPSIYCFYIHNACNGLMT
jgi:hypothetical protein